MQKQLMFLLFTFSAFSLIAQNIQEGIQSMSKGPNNAYSILLLQTSEKDAVKAWKKQLKKQYKAKTRQEKNSEELFSDDAKIKEMSKNTVDVYARFDQQGADLLLTVWFDLGGVYLSSISHTEQSQVAHKMINSYALGISRALAQSILDNKQKELLQMEEELQKMEKKQKRLQKEIDDAKAYILKREKDLKNNLQAQEEQKQKISTKSLEVSEARVHLDGNGKKKK